MYKIVAYHKISFYKDNVGIVYDFQFTCIFYFHDNTKNNYVFCVYANNGSKTNATIYILLPFLTQFLSPQHKANSMTRLYENLHIVE